MTIRHIRETLNRLEAVRYAYESPPEESLGERIAGALARGVQYSTQVWVDTAAGPFRLDMLLVHPSGRRVAIEVDGRDFHDPQRDRWRTVFVLCTGKVQVVYRVPAALIYTNLIGVLSGLASVERQFFDPSHSSRWSNASADHWEQAGADDDELDRDDDESCEGSSRPDRWHPSSRPFTVNFRGDIQDCASAAIMPYVAFARDWAERYRPAERAVVGA